jgi:hypothetical protein
LKEQISNSPPGLPSSPPYGLQLNICAQTKIGEKCEGLAEGRYSFCCKRGTEPGSRTVTTYSGQGHRTDLAAPICRAFEPIVMQQNWLAVGGETDVQFDPLAIECFCSTEPGEGVFGRVRSRAAVTNHAWEANSVSRLLPGEPRRSFGCRLPHRQRDARGMFAAVLPCTGRFQVAALTCCSWRSSRREPRSSPVS